MIGLPRNSPLTEEVNVSSASVIRQLGYKEGRADAYKEILDMLDEEYMSNKVKRGTQYAEDILELVRKLGRKMRGE